MTHDDVLTKILGKLVDVDQYMHEHMFTIEAAQEMKSELMTHIDGFIKLHETLSLELTSMRAKNERLEERIQKIELKLGIA